MIVEFSFENLRSFRDIQNFTMQAAPLRSNDSGLGEGSVFKSANDIRLLKSKVLFGPNASGKSNIIRAFNYFISMVKNSVSEEKLPYQIWKDRFSLIEDWDDQPIFFQLIFISEQIQYRYGFTLLDGLIQSEWLFGRPNVQEVKYFVRTPDELDISDINFKNAKLYRDLTKDGNHEIFRSQSLFLTGTALMGNAQAQTIRNAITNIILIDGLSDRKAATFSMNMLEHGGEAMVNAIKSLISAVDPSIKDLKVLTSTDDGDDNNIPGQNENRSNSLRLIKTLYSFRELYNSEGQLIEQVPTYFGTWESEGTRKLFDISGIILHALQTGSPLIIDEFDARLHPSLSLSIIQLFHNPDTNPNNAQLIFATHDVSLLARADFRRDQICLVDKDKFGISSFHTLIEYKGVRKDSSYEKDYLQGKYGAIPFLGTFNHIIESLLSNDESGTN